MAERCPDCTWIEVPNPVPGSPVKAYAKTQECATCSGVREAAAAAAAYQEQVNQASVLKAEFAQNRALSELQASGILDGDGLPI